VPAPKRFNKGSISVPEGALRHLRCHPCRVFSYGYGSQAFTAVTRVQIPSGTPSLFSNLRF
jgi:hypothetical protein